MTQQGLFSFAVELLEPNSLLNPGDELQQSQVIGFVGIASPPEIFYIFDDHYWGKGLATEALTAFLKSYWSTFPDGNGPAGNVLEAHIVSGNIGSSRVVSKCGFVHVREEVEHEDGKETKIEIYQLKKGD
jgi:RimJ/RimL family protein N-acetyltransferase